VGWAFSFLPPLLFWLGWRFTFSSSRAGGVVFFLLTDRAGPGVSVRGIRCGGPDPVQRCRCVCACVWRPRARAVRAPGGCSGECPSDMAATRTRRRGRVAGVIAHGVAVAWVWRGWAKAMAAAWLGPVLGVRTHARGAWLPRTAARPCRARSTGDPGPRHDAAARGRWRRRGQGRRVGLLQETNGTVAGGKGVLGFPYRGFIGGAKLTPAAREKKGRRR
jgi:hypothetical protein